MSDYPQHLTLAEIDRAAGQAKGSAFKAFKRLNGKWQEGLDYLLLHPQTDAEAIAELKASQRAYHSSVTVLLLSQAAAKHLLEHLDARQRAAGNIDYQGTEN